MQLYAYTLPAVPEKTGWLKIGQTSGSVEERIKAQLSQANIKPEIVWQASATVNRHEVTDRDIHRELVQNGFEKDNEWFRCAIDDVKNALETVKERYRKEDRREQLTNEFYEKLRNWYYWANAELRQGDILREPDPDYTIRIIVRLLFCFFLKEKELIPKELFDKNWLDENCHTEEHSYYNVVLRNLFFLSLNKPLNKRGELENRKRILHYSAVKEQLHKNIPFLNGGIFDEEPGDDFALSNVYFFSDMWTITLPELDGRYPVQGIIKTLLEYKYTLDETEDMEYIDPEFIGKIFESLLACISADSKETRRKITGSYYTPREIVDYMVNETLNIHLDDDACDENALLRCTVFDPACGSGTFPQALMNEIIRRIDPDKKMPQSERYQKKLEILRNVIYGVDIQPMAVQITVLRLFLSLIQEIKPTKNSKENFGIEPLPNLEYKFACANTLVGVDGNGAFFRDYQSEFNQIQTLKSDYFRENKVTVKERSRQRIETIEQEIATRFRGDVASFQKQITDLESDIAGTSNEALRDGLEKRLTRIKTRLQKMISEEAVAALCRWNHSDREPAPYFDSRWMFGIEKFDIVIGNPPYNVIESKDEMKTVYEKKYTSWKSGRINIYQLFFAKAVELLIPKGILAFIHPKTLLTDKYLSATRKKLLKEFPSFTIVNIVKERGTFSRVTQSVVISLWNKKDKRTDCRLGEVQTKYEFPKLQYLIKPKKDIVTKQETLLICAQEEFYTIEKKIRSVPHFFLQFVTGSTEWNKVKKHLSGQTAKNSKRLIYGENVQRFGFAPSSKRAGTSFLDGKAKVPALQQLAVLTQRTVNFALPHRIVAALFEPTTFDTPLVTENSVNVLSCEDRNAACFYLAVLNSRLLNFYFRLHNSNNHVSSGELNRLPIINLPPERQQPLIELVEHRMKGDMKVDAEIDKLVYELYGLTPQEQEFIKNYDEEFQQDGS